MAAAERIVDWDQLYPGRFFKGGDLKNAEVRVFTISAVSVEPLEGDKGVQEKGIISFVGEKQQLALNKTNGICLREMFGRVPYKWVGRRFALYGTMYGEDPCLRVWGSPELAEDMVIEIKLPKKKPFKMTMHAMGDRGTLDAAGDAAARKLTPVREPLSERCDEILKMMAGAKTDDELTDIEADFATEQFNDREERVLAKALAKRRAQLLTEAANNDIIS